MPERIQVICESKRQVGATSRDQGADASVKVIAVTAISPPVRLADACILSRVTGIIVYAHTCLGPFNIPNFRKPSASRMGGVTDR